jgi:hypothetical protein
MKGIPGAFFGKKFARDSHRAGDPIRLRAVHQKFLRMDRDEKVTR